MRRLDGLFMGAAARERPGTHQTWSERTKESRDMGHF